MATKTKMTIFGVGPRLIITTLPFGILASIIIIKYPDFLVVDFLNNTSTKIIGFVWLAIGLIFFIITIRIFTKDFKMGKLITHGTYSLSRNPIYASFIVFLIPALAIIYHSGLIFSIALALYVNFKVLIREEYNILKKEFDEEYVNYAKKVNEIIPIPKFWRN